MKKILIASTMMALTATSSFAQEKFNAEEELAYTLGVQAFIYGQGPLTISQVRKTSTATDVPLNNAMAPLNKMGKTRQLAGPMDRIVPTVNNDTLYSQAHFDLDISGPMVLEIPKTDDRFYIIQLLDGYSDSVDDLIKANAGSEGSKFLLVNKGWKGEVPEGISGVVESRTPTVWLIHRTGVAGKKDLTAALKVHDGFLNYPLSEYNQPHGVVKLAQAKTAIPAMARLEGLEWFSYIDAALRKNPIATDAPMVEQFQYIGIGKEQPFNADDLSPAQKKGLLRAITSGKKMIQFAGRNLGESNNGWSMMFAGGRYGNDYLSRASINMRAAGLNVPERALYPNRYTDSKGIQLSGEHNYRMTMPADAPAKEFWSLTMYDAKDLFMVENEIDRYSISSNRKDELKYAKDGSVPVCIQHKRPEDKSCNWLPAPKDDFYLHMRLYEPVESVLNNKYPLPQVYKK